MFTAAPQVNKRFSPGTPVSLAYPCVGRTTTPAGGIRKGERVVVRIAIGAETEVGKPAAKTGPPMYFPDSGRPGWMIVVFR